MSLLDRVGLFGGRRELRGMTRGTRDRVEDETSVIVVGGGLAGVAAACVLSERGVRVTLLEKEPHLGGRVAAWTERLPDGTPFEMERGFHAFFRQYYNLRNLLRRVDPDLERLRPLARATSPFHPPPAGPLGRTAHFVEPALVCRVAFAEWTDDDKIRHPVYRGLAEGVDPSRVARETR